MGSEPFSVTSRNGSWVPTVEDVRARQMPPTLLFIQVPEGKRDEPRTVVGFPCRLASIIGQ